MRSDTGLILFKATVYGVMMAYVTTEENCVESPGKLTCLIEGRTN